ncbi:MAG: non-hydrolyzing UDP-N-acetylglucosamine 2-epimerase [Bacteroidales bacterium]
MKILTVVGARPQFIKAATVSRQLKKVGIKEAILHTGQHFDHNMSQVFFEEMEIPTPDYNLNIHGLNHGAMTGRMLEGIERILLKDKPNLMMVYGDTNSTLAGALAAQKLHIPVAHVEAGLRSYNMSMPEETNRILTDRISNYLFCPTQTAVNNLNKEGFSSFNCTIENSGDVMLDAALFYGERSSKKSTAIKNHGLDSDFVLATVHRQENTDNPDRLKSIVESFNTINQDVKVVVPLHPRTSKKISELKLKVDFLTIPPVGYFDMVELLKSCTVVMTDSGGLQKEAFFFKKSCITLRQETEWTELVDGGYNYLAGNQQDEVISSFRKALKQTPDFSKQLYGSGNAATKIVNTLRTLP